MTANIAAANQGYVGDEWIHGGAALEPTLTLSVANGRVEEDISLLHFGCLCQSGPAARSAATPALGTDLTAKFRKRDNLLGSARVRQSCPSVEAREELAVRERPAS